MDIFKNKISYAVLAVAVIVSVIFGYLKYKKSNNREYGEQNNVIVSEVEVKTEDRTEQGGDRKQENTSNQEEEKQAIIVSDMPKELSGLKFSDPYQKEDYEKAIKAEEDIRKNPDDYYNYNSAGFWWKSLVAR